MHLCWLAAPFGGVPDNLKRARRWFRWLLTDCGVAVVAPWITAVSVLDDGSPEERQLGLRANGRVIASVDALVLVGGRITAGMAWEVTAATAAGVLVINLTSYDREPSIPAKVALEEALASTPVRVVGLDPLPRNRRRVT